MYYFQLHSPFSLEVWTGLEWVGIQGVGGLCQWRRVRITTNHIPCRQSCNRHKWGQQCGTTLLTCEGGLVETRDMRWHVAIGKCQAPALCRRPLWGARVSIWYHLVPIRLCLKALSDRPECWHWQHRYNWITTVVTTWRKPSTTPSRAHGPTYNFVFPDSANPKRESADMSLTF